MDQNWIELLAMPNRSQDATFVLARTLRDGLPLLLRAAARKSRSRDSFDMSSVVIPPLEQAPVVPSEPEARKLSRDSVPVIRINKKRPFQTTYFPTLLDRLTDVGIFQEHDNIARGMISMESLCLRLQIGTVIV